MSEVVEVIEAIESLWRPVELELYVDLKTKFIRIHKLLIAGKRKYF